MSKRKKTCCFTGHRKISADRSDILKFLLEHIIRLAVQKSYRTFITGGAVGFDTLAAQAVLNAKQIYKRKKIKLILAIPYPEQADKWDKSDVDEYERIKALADKVIYISAEKKKGCMHKRNRYMVDNSSLCVAYMTKKSGGTAYTMNYAEENQVMVFNIAEFVELAK